MQGNLNDLIKKNLKENERILQRSKRKYNNQELKEINFRRKLKKGFVYGAIFSIIGLGIYGGNHYRNEYQNYIAQQNKKMVYYQKEFNKVKRSYNSRNYMYADKLSEELQEEMSNESFLSPTNDLYDKVKEYDNKFIDPKVKRIKRERFKRKLKELPYKIKDGWDETKYRLEDKWDYATPKEKACVVVGGMVLFALFCKLLFRKK